MGSPEAEIHQPRDTFLDAFRDLDNNITLIELYQLRYQDTSQSSLSSSLAELHKLFWELPEPVRKEIISTIGALSKTAQLWGWRCRRANRQQATNVRGISQSRKDTINELNLLSGCFVNNYPIPPFLVIIFLKIRTQPSWLERFVDIEEVRGSSPRVHLFSIFHFRNHCLASHLITK